MYKDLSENIIFPHAFQTDSLMISSPISNAPKKTKIGTNISNERYQIL